MKQDLVKEGYNKIAMAYTEERSELKTDKYLRKFMRMMGNSGQVLDVGCGSGKYVDDKLAHAGYWVTGIDISIEMIKLARKYCPTCLYEVRDLLSLKRGEYSVDGIISLYTMFHVPRSQHEEVLKIFASFLKTGSPLFITMGESDFEGEHEMYGTKMWSSQWGPVKNLEMLKNAGFEIVESEIDLSGREKHQVIIARKVKK